MNDSKNLIEQLKSDEKYKRILKAAPDESREHIKATVEEFLNNAATALDQLRNALHDPETKQNLKRALSEKSKSE